MRGHRVGVVGLDGVVHDPVQVGSRAGEQRAQHGRVQPAAAQHRQAGLDRAAGQLVPEGHPGRPDLQHAAPLGLLQHVHPAGQQRLDQLEPDQRRHHGELLHGRAGRLGQLPEPGHDGVADGARHLAGRRGQRLGDEERVPAGQRVHLGRAVRVAGQLGHRRRRQRLRAQPARAGQLAEQGAQRMARLEVTRAQRQHQQAVPVADAPGQVPQQVEGGVVGPVHVLHREHGHRRPVQLGDGRGEHPLGPTGPDRRGQRPGGVDGRVAQRPERAAGAQVVAAPDEGAHAPVERRQERPQQAGLADAGLALDQHHAAVPGPGRGDRLEQRVDQRRPLQDRGGHPGSRATRLRSSPRSVCSKPRVVRKSVTDSGSGWRCGTTL